MWLNSLWPLVRLPAGEDVLDEGVDNLGQELLLLKTMMRLILMVMIITIIRRDSGILPYGPTAKMLRDSDPEKACAIKCYSTDSKEVMMRIVLMGKMVIRMMRKRMVIRRDL